MGSPAVIVPSSTMALFEGRATPDATAPPALVRVQCPPSVIRSCAGIAMTSAADAMSRPVIVPDQDPAGASGDVDRPPPLGNVAQPDSTVNITTMINRLMTTSGDAATTAPDP